MNGIALNSAVFNGARIIGPAIAGLLISAVGIAACFYINALSYVAIIIMLGMMRLDRPEEKPKPRPVLKELHEGLIYVRKTPVVLLFHPDGRHHEPLRNPVYRSYAHLRAGHPAYRRKGPRSPHGLRGRWGVNRRLKSGHVRRVRQERRHRFAAAFISSLALLGFSFSRVPLLSYALLMVIGWGMITQLATVNTAIQQRGPRRAPRPGDEPVRPGIPGVRPHRELNHR